MIMADLLSVVLLVVGSILVVNSYWLAAVSLAPALVERARQQYAAPIKATGLGLMIALPFAGLGAFLLKTHSYVGYFFGFIAFGIPAIVGLAGSTGLAQKIGAGLPSTVDGHQPWRRVLRGGTVFTLTMLLPFVGWFVIFPWALLSGLGAAALAIAESRKHPRVSATPNSADVLPAGAMAPEVVPTSSSSR